RPCGGPDQVPPRFLEKEVDRPSQRGIEGRGAFPEPGQPGILWGPGPQKVEGARDQPRVQGLEGRQPQDRQFLCQKGQGFHGTVYFGYRCQDGGGPQGLRSGRVCLQPPIQYPARGTGLCTIRGTGAKRGRLLRSDGGGTNL